MPLHALYSPVLPLAILRVDSTRLALQPLWPQPRPQSLDDPAPDRLQQAHRPPLAARPYRRSRGAFSEDFRIGRAIPYCAGPAELLLPPPPHAGSLSSC